MLEQTRGPSPSEEDQKSLEPPPVLPGDCILRAQDALTVLAGRVQDAQCLADVKAIADGVENIRTLLQKAAEMLAPKTEREMERAELLRQLAADDRRDRAILEARKKDPTNWWPEEFFPRKE